MLAPRRVLGLRTGHSALRRAPREEAASTLSRIYPLAPGADWLQASLVCWGRRRAPTLLCTRRDRAESPPAMGAGPHTACLEGQPRYLCRHHALHLLGDLGALSHPSSTASAQTAPAARLGGGGAKQGRVGVGRRSRSMAPDPPGPTALLLCPQPAQFQQQTGPADPGADPGAPGQPPPQPDQHQTEL